MCARRAWGVFHLSALSLSLGVYFYSHGELYRCAGRRTAERIVVTVRVRVRSSSIRSRYRRLGVSIGVRADLRAKLLHDERETKLA